MKIYEIGTGYTPIPAAIGAATEIVVEELTKALAEQGQDVQILDICTDRQDVCDLPITRVKVPKLFRGTDVKLGILHKLKRVAYSVALARQLGKILRRSREPVALHFHNQYNLFFFLKLTGAALRRKATILYTNHSGIWGLDWQQAEPVLRRRYFQEWFCMEQADLVFVLNEAMARNVTEHLNVTKEKLRLITNGVNTRIYHPLEQEENEKTKETWGLAGKRVFLQVGSVYENKGQLRMLQALAPVLKEDKDAVFAFVGGIVSPEYHEEVLKTAEEIGLREQVRYLGTVCPGEELNRLYSMADAMVVASRYEGFSLVIAEAMAAGTPVLLHKASPYSLGEGCVYFDEDTVKDAIAGLNHELSAAARANAEENLTWDAVAKKYLQALRKEKVLRT